MNLLVVDWDYFFPFEQDEAGPALYDWGHFETPYHLEEVWRDRALDFLLCDRPLPGTTGRERRFWSRFRLTPGAVLYYADSNALAWDPRVRAGVRAVWLYDAHHDCGYGSADSGAAGQVRCDDWMCAYHRPGAELRVRYPRWRAHAMWSEPEPRVPVDRRVDDEAPVRVVFDRVFVCRSGAWTPPWLDEAFFAFLRAAPAARRVNLDGVRARRFDREGLERSVAAERAGLAILRLVQGSPVVGGRRAC
ncbi:hypothetical protein C3Y87_01375 [Carbonactinospora thermoautotrophica]|uniref:hypothetical protein n=1 Tax=Carbonactinospora thermoautotrophica TaxID=1469144 RepID=UPI00226EE42C|nr:hypothetical protein [Carbonactinospora thermoautotrophica]MCX9190083.1 hypothetical protein [Carbonactinospora thermoautotrophica]